MNAPRTVLSRLDLEALISDARDAMIVLDLVVDALNACRIKSGDRAAEHGYTVLHLTEDQDRALFAAKMHAYLMSEKLEDAFEASKGPIQ